MSKREQPSRRERMSHVVRRLSMGAHPDLVAELDSTFPSTSSSIDGAIARALDLSVAVAPTLPPMDPPVSYDTQKPIEIVPVIQWWLEQMRTNPRLIEERLVWFWHDHFATSLAKVRQPYLMHQQHATVRAHATGSFAELLHAMAKDPAMLLYLDGVTNEVHNVNENFGRECLELFTMGIGAGYTQTDVVEASRAFTGWVVNVQGRPFSARLNERGVAPWGAVFVAQRHDSGSKQLLGRTGAFDLDGALDVVLDHPATSRFVAGKLYRELVGLEADDSTAKRLGAAFAKDWSIMGLVEAIASEPAFTSGAAVRAKVRTPVEKLVGIAQAAGVSIELGRAVPRGPNGSDGKVGARRADARGLGAGEALRTINYIPFVPPNVSGFPEGASLLGPHSLVHAVDLLQVVPVEMLPVFANDEVDDLLARFGIFDVEARTRKVLQHASDAETRFALAALAPEFALT